MQNFESKVDDKKSKQLQIDNNIQISNLTQIFNDLHINDDYMDNNYWQNYNIKTLGMSLDDLMTEYVN